MVLLRTQVSAPVASLGSEQVEARDKQDWVSRVSRFIMRFVAFCCLASADAIPLVRIGLCLRWVTKAAAEVKVTLRKAASS